MLIVRVTLDLIPFFLTRNCPFLKSCHVGHRTREMGEKKCDVVCVYNRNFHILISSYCLVRPLRFHKELRRKEENKKKKRGRRILFSCWLLSFICFFILIVDVLCVHLLRATVEREKQTTAAFLSYIMHQIPKAFADKSRRKSIGCLYKHLSL